MHAVGNFAGAWTSTERARGIACRALEVPLNDLALADAWLATWVTAGLLETRQGESGETEFRRTSKPAPEGPDDAPAGPGSAKFNAQLTAQAREEERVRREAEKTLGRSMNPIRAELEDVVRDLVDQRLRELGLAGDRGVD